MPSIPLERFAGCLVGLATGDALGAPFEGMPADHVFWVHGPIHEWLDAPDLDILRTTDDTQMTRGVAEELIGPSGVGIRVSAHPVARALAAASVAPSLRRRPTEPAFPPPS